MPSLEQRIQGQGLRQQEDIALRSCHGAPNAR